MSKDEHCDVPNHDDYYTPRLNRILSHSYLGYWPTQEDTALAIAEVKALRDELDTLRAENEKMREALTRCCYEAQDDIPERRHAFRRSSL